MCDLVCIGIEVMGIAGFVDTDTPEDDGRMVPVALNHLADVFFRHFLPFQVTDVLPTRNLFEDQEADFIASIQESGRLRIVRRTGEVQTEIVLQNIGVFALSTGRHRITDIWIRLVTVQSTQEDFLPVE